MELLHLFFVCLSCYYYCCFVVLFPLFLFHTKTTIPTPPHILPESSYNRITMTIVFNYNDNNRETLLYTQIPHHISINNACVRISNFIIQPDPQFLFTQEVSHSHHDDDNVMRFVLVMLVVTMMMR